MSSKCGEVSTQTLEKFLAQAETKLKVHFGHEALKPLQKQVLGEIFRGHDVVAMIPTGYGKSMTYILPALVQGFTVLVVSPLISLIHDQVKKLRTSGLEVLSFDRLQTSEERSQVWSDMRTERIDVIFASPERMSIPGFRERIQKLCNIGLVAIDEAHCVSTWGRNFRPSYMQLDQYLVDFPDAQRLALTATATDEVRKDIVKYLGLRKPKVFTTSPIRENLQIKVFSTPVLSDLNEEIGATVDFFSGSGIVYAASRKRVEEIYHYLKKRKVSVGFYHAGQNGDARASSQESFLSGAVRVMVATTAFGMGIDKPDIRFVIHASLPQSLEQYVQEIGRAGRDGKKAYAYLFFSGRDYHIQKFIIEKGYPDTKQLKAVQDYITPLIPRVRSLQEESKLYGDLKQKLNVDREGLLTLLRGLEREGIFSRKFIQESGVDEAFNQQPPLEISLNEEQFELYMKRIPKEIKRDMKKLGQMFDYATASGGRRQTIVEDYFGTKI